MIDHRMIKFASEAMVASRRAQEACSSMLALIRGGPHAADMADIVAEMETGTASATADLTRALDALIDIAGTPDVGAAVLAAINAVIRLEKDLCRARNNLSNAAADAMKAAADELHASIPNERNWENWHRIVFRGRALESAAAQLRTNGASIDPTGRKNHGAM